MDKRFSRDLVLKILSVLVAIIMWLYVMNEQNPKVTYVIKNVPVKLINLDEERFAVKEDDSDKFFVNVKVSGRRSQIVDLKPGDFTAKINLKGRIQGENLLPVSVTVPEKVQLVDFYPREILVVLDTVSEKLLPVTVDIIGSPASGFATLEPDVNPKEVKVRGPSSLVNSIKKITAQVNISSDLDTDVEKISTLKPLNSRGKEITGVVVNPNKVKIKIPIVPITNITLIPNIRGNPKQGYVIKNVKINPTTIGVTSSEDSLKDIKYIYTEVIDVEGINRTIVRKVNIILPSGISFVDESDKVAEVTVEIEKISTKNLSFYSREIEINNLPKDMEASIENNTVNLTIEGPEDNLKRLNKNNIRLFVDASGLSEGEHTLQIKYDIPEPYKVSTIQPDSIKLTLEHIAQ